MSWTIEKARHRILDLMNPIERPRWWQFWKWAAYHRHVRQRQLVLDIWQDGLTTSDFLDLNEKTDLAFGQALTDWPIYRPTA